MMGRRSPRTAEFGYRETCNTALECQYMIHDGVGRERTFTEKLHYSLGFERGGEAMVFANNSSLGAAVEATSANYYGKV
jgi:hypothetical protein